jgi:uncharacterized BrkB/YihY/UPF0761 family membrane protein
VLVLLVWFYAMSQIVLVGAVLTRQIDEHPASRPARGGGGPAEPG